MNEINLKSETLLDIFKQNETMILELQLRVARQKEEIEKIQLYTEMKLNEERIKTYQKQNEDFKENVKNTMLSNWLKSLETFSHKITVKWTVGSLKIIDENIVPQDYIKEVKPVFDNAKIKSDIKDWKEIPWCSLVEGWSLVITEK